MISKETSLVADEKSAGSVAELHRIARHRQIYGSMADDVPVGVEPREGALVLAASVGTVGAGADKIYATDSAFDKLRLPKIG